MLKQMLTAASLTVLLAGPGHAAEDPRRGKAVPAETVRQKAPPPTGAPKRVAAGHAPRGHDDDRGRGHDRDDGDHGGRDREHRDDGWRDHDGHDDDRHDRDWHDNDHDGRDRDWRRDDDWRRHGWVYQGGRADGWRYYRGHDNRHWRYVPPSRYSFDFGYRSAYELAWRDWLAHGRHDRGWRRPGYGYGTGYYRAGYEAGWRDAASYYARGYRPDSWAYDPQGGWFFGFRIEG